MNIQSLSIVVPNKKCINKCPFCVSRMNCDSYPNMMDENLPFYDLYERDYIKRLEFARDNGCNTVMLTGDSEPQQNRAFLQRFGTMNRELAKPFRKIEIQTTGTLLDKPYLRFLRNHVGVNTISLSVSGLTDADNNAIIQPPKPIDLKLLCSAIKEYDFNLRISLNLLKDMENYWHIDELFEAAKHDFKADQLTFRVMYSDNSGTSVFGSSQSKFVKENSVSAEYINEITQYIKGTGYALERLEYGRTKYQVNRVGVVIDDDCMSKEVKDVVKYVNLRPNCKLYTKWDDPASLIF